MPDELKVTHMGLLSEGVELETFPSSPTIPAESGPYPVKITSKPTSSGELTVLGMSFTVLAPSHTVLTFAKKSF